MLGGGEEGGEYEGEESSPRSRSAARGLDGVPERSVVASTPTPTPVVVVVVAALLFFIIFVGMVVVVVVVVVAAAAVVVMSARFEWMKILLLFLFPLSPFVVVVVSSRGRTER